MTLDSETRDSQNVEAFNMDNEEIDAGNELGAEIHNETKQDLIYGLTDSPPFHITIICGLQQALISLTSGLVVSSLVAQVVCAADNDVFKARLLSSTLFMNGFTTVAMNLFGVRLALYQGATAEYVLPLLLIGSSGSTFCNSKTEKEVIVPSNSTLNATESEDAMERILLNVRALQGSLMLAGIVQAMMGFTGFIGVLLNFIGPLTIVPSMVLLCVFLVDTCITFVEGHWGIGLSTAAIGIILSLYLANHKMPIPIWTPSLGFRIIWYPLHQVFALLITILINWLICGILTKTDMLTSDPNDVGYRTRTDARSSVISDAPWFNFPYPGQYGMMTFSGSAFVCYIIATIISILDSLGDYFACARTCNVPPPPNHAVNRGILIEGLCSFLSGTIGCGHATTTYGDNIGAISVTKVASRRVFVTAGILYIFFGVIGKFSAVFITIPYPVLGGAAIIMFSTFLGVALSNLQVISLSSSRNMSILGIAIILGLMIPTFVNNREKPFDTGSEAFDRILVMVFGNVNFCGPVIAFILDNTIPGTKKERGLSAWQIAKSLEEAEGVDSDFKTRVKEIYTPLIPRKCLQFKFIKYVPFLPFLEKSE